MSEETRNRGDWGGDWGGWPFRGQGFGRGGPFGGFDLRTAFGPWRPPGPPRPPGHGPRGGRGGRGRHGRGNVRAAVLALLLERPMHGYEMIQQLDERTNGMWRPSPGSIYPTLQLLEDEGLIVSEQVEGKRRYSLTDEGRARAEQVEDVPWRQQFEGFDWETLGKLRDAAAGLMTAFGQLMSTATAEQKARAIEVLHETRRKLYAILAEGATAADDDDEDDDES